MALSPNASAPLEHVLNRLGIGIHAGRNDAPLVTIGVKPLAYEVPSVRPQRRFV
jgi:hypothetical protein